MSDETTGLAATEGEHDNGYAGLVAAVTKATERVDPQAVEELARIFHNVLWLETMRNEDGTIEPRFRTTTDADWVARHGTDQVDIAKDYVTLPADRQAENRNAASLVLAYVAVKVDRGEPIQLMLEGNLLTSDDLQQVSLVDPAVMMKLDIADLETRTEAGNIVHDGWKSRNPDRARSEPELGGDFSQLSLEEQAKDIRQVTAAETLRVKHVLAALIFRARDA